MASYSGRGGHRGGHRGGGRGISFDDRPPLARRPGIRFTHGVIELPIGDRIQGPRPNIVIFFRCINFMFTYYTRIIILFSYNAGSQSFAVARTCC